ncbi:MAG: FAD-dependent oxidoreductase [Deltaproteobacteria bacterium]|nr:FAD-dependent oxidoreductase [Deltaproteobacteria bacterium]
MHNQTNTNGHGEAPRFAEAISTANIPTLLMVLVQLTGDLCWLEEPYRPLRARGMNDNDTGGLPEPIQAEVRKAAVEAILAWRAGRPVAMPEPSAELRCKMLSRAVAEEVPAEYDPIIAADLPLAQHEVTEKLPVPDGFEVLIIGAGVSGLCAAINLQRAGIPFTILEKSTRLGGIWRDNRYPGAGVDTPNHLYSYTFAPYDWSMYFALRDELHAYLEHVAEKFNLRPHIRFETEVKSADYDKETQRWNVAVRHGDGSHETLKTNILISAVGIFNPIKLPDIKGLERFAGPCFHTAEWPADVDLTGKRVAIIGNGASAMQVGPEIQHIVKSLTIFQRSPHWVAPNEQFRKPIPDAMRFLLREVPLYRAWYRIRLGWTFGDRIHSTLQKDPNWPYADRSLNKANDTHRGYFTHYIVSELGDKTELLDQVVPTYPPFGKRMLMDNGWYRMLRNERVQLVSDPIVEIGPDRVITKDGTAYEADVLIVATGFDVLRFLTAFEARGRSGRSLREVWNDDDAKAYLGLAVPDFPNFFCLYGPNLQPGHGGSLIFVVEMQMRYIMDVLKKMLTQDLGAVECRQDVHDAYNERIDQAHANMVWTHPGMETYYRNAHGRIVVNSPYRNATFYEMTRAADLGDFMVEPRQS